MIWRLKRIWRRLIRSCVYCGEKHRVTANPNDVYARRLNACRKCNKVLSFGELYGAGQRKLRQICEEL